MLTLRRTEKTKTAVVYEYYPEGDTTKPGVLKIDLETGNVELVQRSEEDLSMYIMHAVNVLENFYKNNSYPLTSGTAWY